MNTSKLFRFLQMALIVLFFAGCGDDKKDDKKDDKQQAPITEKGDAPGDCSNCQEIPGTPPFNIMGEIKGANDVDCYCFTAKKGVDYHIGITGSNRKITASGNKEIGEEHSIDGLCIYRLDEDGKICFCISGGAEGAYAITVFPF